MTFYYMQMYCLVSVLGWTTTFLYIFLMMAWLFILLIRCWDVLFDPDRREE
jgi:hypothetical protein